MPRIGRRDKLVMLERSSLVKYEHDEEVDAWAPIGKEWAAIFYGRGDERRQAAAEAASQTATFQMLANSRTRSLTTSNRIAFEGLWDITGVALDVPQNGFVEATATKQA